MRGIPIRFPNAYPLSGDEELNSFLATNERDLHNSWPEIADFSDLRLAWSNPLIRLWYLPIPGVGQYMADPATRISSLPLKIAWVHERSHILHDFSPLKELARIWLSEIYDDLTRLFVLLSTPTEPSQEQIIKIVQDFSIFHQYLGSIFDQIYLAEELMATAVGFCIIEKEISNQKRDEFEQLEKAWVSQHGAEFQRLYHSGFKKAIRLITNRGGGDKAFTTLARLTIYLQGISDFDVVNHVPVVAMVNSWERCQNLVDFVSQTESLNALLTWLTQSITDEEINTWRRILALEADCLKHATFPFVQNLVRERPLSKNGTSENWARKYQNWYWNWPSSKNKRWPKASYSLLYPDKIGKRWYIRRWFFNEGNLGMLVRFDSYRQQLNHGVGFVCPFVDINSSDGTVRCACIKEHEDFRLIAQRMTRLALNGIFGDGRWHDLAYPCNSIRP